MNSQVLRNLNSILYTGVRIAPPLALHPRSSRSLRSVDRHQTSWASTSSTSNNRDRHQRSMGSTTHMSASVSAADAATASQTAAGAAASAAASAAEAKEASRVATAEAAAAAKAAAVAADYAAQANSASAAAAAVQNGNAAANASSSSQPPLLLVVGVALLQSSGPQSGARVLLAQRPPGKANAGLWEFPGGKVNPGETPEAALVRELKEELDIEVEEGQLKPLSFVSFPYPTFHMLMPLYECSSWRGTARGAEGQAIVYCSAGDLENGRYSLTPADIPLIPAVLSALRR